MLLHFFPSLPTTTIWSSLSYLWTTMTCSMPFTNTLPWYDVHPCELHLLVVLPLHTLLSDEYVRTSATPSSSPSAAAFLLNWSIAL
jgi:hypothetical protein